MKLKKYSAQKSSTLSCTNWAFDKYAKELPSEQRNSVKITNGITFPGQIDYMYYHGYFFLATFFITGNINGLTRTLSLFISFPVLTSNCDVN